MLFEAPFASGEKFSVFVNHLIMHCSVRICILSAISNIAQLGIAKGAIKRFPLIPVNRNYLYIEYIVLLLWPIILLLLLLILILQ